MSIYTQWKDYTTALRTYLKAATGLDDTRVIFAPPDIAQRVLKEKRERAAAATQTARTIEVDKFLSFHISPVTPDISDRQSVLATFLGARSQASRLHGYQITLDIPVQVDIWGGPSQDSQQFVFEKLNKLKLYVKRNREVYVAFQDLITKDPNHLDRAFDANCWWLIDIDDVVDVSTPEDKYLKGTNYRATVNMTWNITFYDIPSVEPIKKLAEIIVQYDATGNDPEAIEVDVTTTTSSSTSSTSSTSSSTSSTLSTTSSTSSTLSTTSSTSSTLSTTSTSSSTSSTSSSTSSSSSTTTTLMGD